MTWWIQSGNRFHAGWPHKTDETFPELREKVIDWPDDWAYRKYELGWLRDDGQPGFNTNTGRWSCTTPCSRPGDSIRCRTTKSRLRAPSPRRSWSEEYPYVLTTGARTWEYFHSESRHAAASARVASRSAGRPASRHGRQDRRHRRRLDLGREHARQVQAARALQRVAELDTVRAEHGWWFPEQEGAEPNLFGVFDSNINNLTVQGVTGPTLYGAPYANQICKIYPVTKENDCSPSEIVTREGGF